MQNLLPDQRSIVQKSFFSIQRLMLSNRIANVILVVVLVAITEVVVRPVVVVY